MTTFGLSCRRANLRADQHGRSVIANSTKPTRVAENLDVFDFELPDEETGGSGSICRRAIRARFPSGSEQGVSRDNHRGWSCVNASVGAVKAVRGAPPRRPRRASDSPMI